jgi:hypothetical protein
MIANSGYDEHGKYSGGTAGDQTGKEWRIIPYYNRPWNCVLRHPDTSVRELIAQLAEEGANNDLIGYDQYERWTFWNQLKTVGYHPKNIKTKCEADCSAGVISIVWAVGHLLGLYRLKELDATYTGNMRQGFKDAGFIVLQESKFLTSDSWLMRGDVLLNDAHHTAINLTTGKNVIVEDDDMTEAEVIQIVKNVLAGYGTEPSKWAVDEDTIKKAKALGITVDGQRPQGYAKREEVFQMLIRMAERLGIKT